jgi:putative hemin transport protein
MSSPHATREDIAARYQQALARDPKRYFRTIADDVGVSELELLVAVHHERITRLRLDALPALFRQLAELGRVRTMTRNDHAVIEQDGWYDGLEFSERLMGQTVGDLDLRIFGWRWAHAYAVVDESAKGTRQSVQFFDGHGTSIHKVYIDDAAAFSTLVGAWQDPADDGALPLVTSFPEPVDRADEAVDVPTLRAAWDGLRDTHDFHALLQRLSVGRLQAMRLAGAERARAVSPDALKMLLELAAERSERIMIFVGNHGVVQIFIGEIRRVVETPGWLNVLDPGFNLHVRPDAIAHAFVVRKPTVDGMVSALECYDARGRLVVQLFGKRLEGQPSPDGWQAILQQVEDACACA